jgi:hypothetical protein
MSDDIRATSILHGYVWRTTRGALMAPLVIGVIVTAVWIWFYGFEPLVIVPLGWIAFPCGFMLWVARRPRTTLFLETLFMGFAFVFAFYLVPVGISLFYAISHFSRIPKTDSWVIALPYGVALAAAAFLVAADNYVARKRTFDEGDESEYSDE